FDFFRMLYVRGSSLFPYTTLFRSGKSPPKLGTYTSGVVIKNVSVIKDIPDVSKPPIKPILAYQMPSNVSVPIITIMAPKPQEKRSEEHTSELQSRENHVCRLLLVR